MLVSEIATRIRRQFGDSFGSRITDDDILRWINDGMREVAQKNELLQISATIPFVIDQAEYAIPTNLMKLLTVTYKGRPLRGMGFREFLDFTQDVEGLASGSPHTFTVWAGSIWLHPTPAYAEEIKIFYIRFPVAVTLMTDTPELPITYHMRLVEYALAQAAEFDEDDDRYQRKMGEFETNTAVLKDDVDWNERDSYPVIAAKPEDYGDAVYDAFTGW